MADPLLWCFDRWGRAIVLSADQWLGKILRDHGELDGHLDALHRTLVDPDVVRRDALHARRENFYRRATLPGFSERDYLKVCVEFSGGAGGGSAGTVITAYPTPTVKRGESQEWP